MAKILIIEDDQIYAQNTRDWLDMQQHLVELTHSGRDGLDLLSVRDFDLIIVDFQLPDMSGPDVVRKFRDSGGRTPVLMLTVRQGLSDKEQGFDAGADDYLDKAVHPRELIMRVAALLRRPAAYTSPIHELGNITFNENTGVLTKSGVSIHLLPKEYALLSFLFRQSDRVFTAEQLLDKVWPSESEATPHTVRSCINRMRTKLDEPDGRSIINTVRGLGYGLNQAYGKLSTKEES